MRIRLTEIARGFSRSSCDIDDDESTTPANDEVATSTGIWPVWFETPTEGHLHPAPELPWPGYAHAAAN